MAEISLRTMSLNTEAWFNVREIIATLSWFSELNFSRSAVIGASSIVVGIRPRSLSDAMARSRYCSAVFGVLGKVVVGKVGLVEGIGINSRSLLVSKDWAHQTAIPKYKSP